MQIGLDSFAFSQRTKSIRDIEKRIKTQIVCFKGYNNLGAFISDDSTHLHAFKWELIQIMESALILRILVSNLCYCSSNTIWKALIQNTNSALFFVKSNVQFFDFHLLLIKCNFELIFDFEFLKNTNIFEKFTIFSSEKLN